jgi:hypothetical protein
MRRWVALLLAIGCGACAAADVPSWMPPSTDTVILRLPANIKASASRRERIAALMDAGSASGEEQYFGQAESLLLAAAEPERSSLNLQYARLLQHRHAFEASLQVLNALIAADGRATDAILMRAQIQLQLMHAHEAMQDCVAIQRFTNFLVFATCAAQARAGLGDVQGGYALVTAAMSRGAPPGATYSWSAGVAAELADRAGRAEEAGGWYAIAWQQDPRSHYARMTYADWLLAQHRAEEAAKVASQSAAMSDRLRTVLAEGRRDSASARRLLLAWQEAQARGDRSYLADHARFEWQLGGSLGTARELALAAFADRADPDSARLLAGIAAASGDRATLQRLQVWRQKQGYVDSRLERLLGAST